MALSEFEAWDPIDQAAALAWRRREQEKCPGCHIHPEITDPEQGGDEQAFVVAKTLCPVCELRERSAEMFAKDRQPGERQVLRPRPPALPDIDI